MSDYVANLAKLIEDSGLDTDTAILAAIGMCSGPPPEPMPWHPSCKCTVIINGEEIP